MSHGRREPLTVAEGTCTITGNRSCLKAEGSRRHQLSVREVVLGLGDFLQYTVIGLTVGSFYALVALGYTIVYGIIRLINFAQGDLSMIGAFLGWTVLVSLGFEHLPIYISLPAAFVIPMIGTAIVNLGILQFAYKPLLKRSLLAILITALGMSLLLQNTAQRIWGAAIEAYPPNLLPLTGFWIGPVHVTYVQVALVLTSLLLMGLLVAFVQGTTLGTAMRALAVDHDAARLMGINVDNVIRIAFVLGAILAAASGVMLGIYYVQIQFTMGFLLGLRAFTAAVLGGIGNIPGAMAGGLMIGLLEAYTTGYLSGTWEDVVVFGVLISVLIVKPTGIFGERVAERM
jgi:branched-chain amino acid transport system permease protein